MSEARDIENLFAVWEHNVDTVRALNRSLKQDHLPNSGIAPQLVAHLKQTRHRSRQTRAPAQWLRQAWGTIAESCPPQDRQERSVFR